MMAGIHQMEQVRFGDTQHFEVQPQGTYAHPGPETSYIANYNMPGDMEQDLQHIYNDYKALQEMLDVDMTVVLNPEVLMCGTNLHPKPQLMFSSDGFKIEYLDSNSGQDDDPQTLFWQVSDIISIDSKWSQIAQSALITLYVRSSAEIINSGPVKVEFCLADPQWELKQQEILQLDSRYQEVWKNIQLDDSASQNWRTEPSLCFPKQYFHGIDDFEDVIYPKGDRDSVSISSRDVELLLPGIFVNDTIIDFYIKYLAQRIVPTERHRYHFFSSFFFRKLADLDKDQENAPKGREAFLNVRKWTRKIDIFGKEFLFIPVNFRRHWSLLVICYPGEVDTFKDGDARVAGKLPCIMHMDSINGTHSGLKDIIQSYLWEEWKERHPESVLDSSDKFLNLRFLSLELPQQDNSYDCGLFLLHYVERFLMDAPSFFNPMKIDVFSSFLNDDWFVPAEASLKRSLIRKLIHELVTEPSKTFPKLVCGDEKHEERHHRSENAVGEPPREFLGQGCFAAEPDSVCRILGAHQQSKNDSERGLSVPGCTLETGGVSVVAQQEMQMCPWDDDIVVCSPSRNVKNEPFFAYSANQLDPKSCAPEDAKKLEGSCSVVEDKNSHQESSLDISDSNQKISSHPEAEVHEHDIMVPKCSPYSDSVNNLMACQGSRNEVEYGRCEASQDMDSVIMLDDIKHDTGTCEESTEGKADNGRCDLFEDTYSFATGGINKDVAEHPFERDIVENMDGRCDLSEDTCSVRIGDVNKGVAKCLSEKNIVEAVDPMALQDDIKAQETSTATDGSETNADDKSDSVFTGLAFCLPSQYAKNEPCLTCSGNQLDLISCAKEDTKSFKEPCSVEDTESFKEPCSVEDTHGESLLDFWNKKQKNSSEAEVEVHQHGIMDSKYFSYSENVDKEMACHEYTDEVENDRCGAPQDTNSVLMLDADKNEIRPCQKSTKGKADDGRRDLSEDTYSVAVSSMKTDAVERSFETNIVKAMDDRCDLSEDARSVMIDGMNSGVAGCSSGSTVEAVDPGAMGDDTNAEKTSTTTGNVNDSEQHAPSESKDGNSVSIMSSVSIVSCGLQEGNVAGSTANGTSETHADGEDAGHNLEMGEVAPCEYDTTCTDAEMPHVNGISTCSAKDGTNSEKATSNARRSLLGSTSEHKSTLVSDDMCSLKGVQCTEDGIMEGSTGEEISTISDKVNDSTQYASSELRDGNTDNTIAAKSTQGSDADGHELAAFPCAGGTDAEVPPHVDGTCSAEDMNDSISDSVCGVKKMQVSGGFQSTLEDGIIKDSTKQETSTVSDKINDSAQYASSVLRDGNTDNAIVGESTRGTDADDLAAFPCDGGIDAEMLPHVDGTCSAEDENISISDSICEAKKMQVSGDFQSTLGDDMVGSTKEETGTTADKMNGSEQYVPYELEDGNTDWAGGEDDVPSEVKNEKCRVGAKRPRPDSSICEGKETVNFDDKFWQEYSERAEGRFGRKYKRRIVWKRRKVISRTPPSSLDSPDLFFSRVPQFVPKEATSYQKSYKRRPKIVPKEATSYQKSYKRRPKIVPKEANRLLEKLQEKAKSQA